MCLNRNDVSYVPGNVHLSFHEITDISVSRYPAVCLAGFPGNWCTCRCGFTTTDRPGQSKSTLAIEAEKKCNLFFPCLSKFRISRPAKWLLQPISVTGLLRVPWAPTSCFAGWSQPSTTGYWPKRSIRSWAVALCGEEWPTASEGSLKSRVVSGWNYADVSFSCFFLFSDEQKT